ncbi:MAG: hypothetical protein ACLSHJ_07010 [Oscillospiraceae bacterium]
MIQASGMTAGDIMAETLTYGYDVIFVDYVQLVVPRGQSARPAQRADGDPFPRAPRTPSPRAAACWWWELAQLSRPERGAWRAPDMHDSLETGQLEQGRGPHRVMVLPSRPLEQNYSLEKCRVIQIAKEQGGPARQGTCLLLTASIRPSRALHSR